MAAGKLYKDIPRMIFMIQVIEQYNNQLQLGAEEDIVWLKEKVNNLLTIKDTNKKNPSAEKSDDIKYLNLLVMVIKPRKYINHIIIIIQFINFMFRFFDFFAFNDPSGTDGYDFRHLRLLFGLAGKHDPALGLLLRFQTLDYDSVSQRFDVHNFCA